jgi:ribosomal protein L11 methyltransferase
VANTENPVHWIEAKLITNGELAEALAEVLGRFVDNGVVVETETRFNPKTQENEPTGNIVIYGYLPADGLLEEKQQKLEEALWHLGMISPLPPIHYHPIQEENWMAVWKTHYQPIRIGENLLIMPAWMEPAKDETRLVVRINPAMAFGTGTHPTTQLCLRLMEAHFTPGSDVIDVGCGSGILSIAALLMGASHVLAVDIDQDALTSTQENTALNFIEQQQMEVGSGSVEEILTGRFTIKQAPLVLVNILAATIVRLFELGLAELVSPNGTILLSGILENQEVEVLQSAKTAGLKTINRLTDGDWVGLTMKKSAI